MRNTVYNPKENGNLSEKNDVKLLNKIVTGILIFITIFCVYSLIATRTYIGAEVDGASMYPTVNATSINDYAYYTTRKTPKKGDIVVIDYRYSGENLKAIKRLIATGGDTICFYDGGIYVNGTKLKETYIEEAYELLNNNQDILDFGGYSSADEWKNDGYQRCKENFEAWCEELYFGVMPETEQKTEFFKNYNEKYSGAVTWNSQIGSYVLKLPENFVFFLGDNRTKSKDASKLGPAEAKYMVGKVDFITSINASFIEKFSKQLIYFFS